MTEQALDQHLDQLSTEEQFKVNLKRHLKDLATIRTHIENSKKELEVAQKALDNTPEQNLVNEVIAEINTLKQSEASFKESVAREALLLSEFSGYTDRKPVSGVQIKEFTVVEILDEKKAKIWASQNAPDTVSLSKSKFDKVAKVLDLDFVKTGTEYRAQVASDLSEYLDEYTTLHSSTTTEE